MTRKPYALVAATLLLFGSSCGLLIGNVKPVDEKSDVYGVMDLSKDSVEWSKLDPVKVAQEGDAGGKKDPQDPDLAPSEVADSIYQSKKTAATIEINSACRAGHDLDREDLKSLSDLLFLGITDVKLREEKKLTIQGTSALETTIRGSLNSDSVMLRTVVLKKNGCVYDLVYLSQPELFAQHESDFTQFVASLRIK